ncbi:hypothetical protein [Vibrio variabilis]|uniref:Kae1-like domain-containing protein n=1 Tax=Vibrio variabilis TaxID=990271 RepID=UPI0013A69206|nr:hypothetical protein [Vibrio variabilis]
MFGFRLIGGEQAIREPARIAFAMLLECFSFEQIKAMHLKVFSNWSDNKIDNLHTLWLKEQNSPKCTSVGRLFDAWASLIGLIDGLDFEGESGLIIENQIIKETHSLTRRPVAYSELKRIRFELSDDGIIDWRPALREVVQRIQSETNVSQAWFCHQLIDAIVSTICQWAGRHPELPVVLAGGVFQNRCLVNEAVSRLHQCQVDVYMGEKVPVNDAGIAVGQAYFGLRLKTK